MLKPHALTRRELLLGTAAAFAGHRLVLAQMGQQAQQPTFSAEVELVNVVTTVRDKKGAIVKDLSKDEFAIREDGRLQTISFFARESDLPLTVGLLVDTTPSESNMLDEERAASLAFLTRMLRPEKDAAFLISYHSKTELLQGLTSSRDDLEAALNRLEAHELGGRGRGPGGERGGGGGWGGGGGGGGSRIPAPPGGPGYGAPGGGYQAALSDAVRYASDRIMRAQQGRKALLILGDGDHLGGYGDEAVAAAQRADTLIYAIRIWDESFGDGRGGQGGQIRIPGLGPITIGPGGGGRGGTGGGMGGPGGGMGGPGGGRGGMHENGKKNLQKLAKETGGAYFEVGKKQPLDEIYARIEEELRSQYSLGYTPDAGALNGYRSIKISVTRKGLTVRGRDGYYGRTK